jgi:hypothetical protein
MLTYFVQQMQDRVLVAMSVCRLRATLQECPDSRAREMARRLQQDVEIPLGEDLPSLFQFHGNKLLRNWKDLPSDVWQDKLQGVFRLLRDSASQLPPDALPQPSEDEETAFSDWVSDAFWSVERRRPLSKVRPATRFILADEVRKLRKEALVCLSWRNWLRNFRQLTTDPETLRKTDRLQEALGIVNQSLAAGVGPAGDQRRQDATEIDLLFESLRFLASSYLKAIEDLRQRLHDSSRHPLGPDVHHCAEGVSREFARAFPLAKRLLDLADSFQSNELLDAGDFLRQPWEGGGTEADCLALGDAYQLELALLADVCAFFDTRPETQSPPGNDRHASALEHFAAQLLPHSGWTPRLVIHGPQDDVQFEPTPNVSDGRRKSSGIVLEREGERLCVRQAVWQVPAPIRRLIDALSQAHRALHENEPLLAAACGELADELVAARSLEEWLSGGGSDESDATLDRPAREKKLWIVVHLADLAFEYCGESQTTTPVASHAQRVLQAIEEFGQVGLEEREIADDGAQSPCWLIHRRASAPGADGGVRLRRRTGLWMTLPGHDAPLAPPAVAILAANGEKNGFDQIWEEVQPLLAELKLRVPNDELWQELDSLFLGGLLDLNRESRFKQAIAIFVRLRDFALAAPTPQQELAFQVLKQLHRALQNHGRPIVPLLDDDNLTPLAASQQPKGKLKLTWRKLPQPAGEIVEVSRFSGNEGGAEAVASGGPSLADFVSEYFSLPAPAGNEEFDRKLRDGRVALSVEERDAATIEAQVKQKLRDAVAWLRQPERRSQFNAWLQTLTHPEDEALTESRWRWYALLYRHGGLRPFPDLDPATQRICLQAQAVVSADLVRWEFAEQPLGGAIDTSRFRFASDASKVEGAFSLGPRAAGGSLLEVETLEQLADSAESNHGKQTLAEALRRVARLCRKQEICRRMDESVASLEPLFAALVKALNTLVESPFDDPAGSDRILQSLRLLAADWGGAITPEDWSFRDPTSKTHPILPWFHPTESSLRCAGVLGIELDGHKQECQLVQYVGQAPPGFKELFESSKRLPAPLRSNAIKRLQEWPRSYLKRNLIQKLVEFHIAWFDELHQQVAASEPELAQEIYSALQRTVRGQRLQFYLASPAEPLPSNRTKYVEITHRSGVEGSNGNGPLVVREVLRPGIRDESNEPLCKARVIVSEAHT